jgi:hypothetical protein
MHKQKIARQENCGPIFGYYEILVSSESNKNKNSRTILSGSFADTTGHGDNTFTGEYCFTTNEIEVYLVCDS